MLILHPHFPCGRLVATPAAIEAASKHVLFGFLERHFSCDWGEVTQSDAEANDYAVRHGLRIISSYLTPHDEKVWIITEADRSATTILLANEY